MDFTNTTMESNIKRPTSFRNVLTMAKKWNSLKFLDVIAIEYGGKVVDEN